MMSMKNGLMKMGSRNANWRRYGRYVRHGYPAGEHTRTYTQARHCLGLMFHVVADSVRRQTAMLEASEKSKTGAHAY